jgi:hypothetical protein
MTPVRPSRDAESSAPPPRFAPAEHSEDQRARASGPSEGRVPWRLRRFLVPASGACALWRMPTAFPSSAPFGHPLSSARSSSWEDPRPRTDRPRPSFRWCPAKSATFQTTRMPLTATTREGVCRGGIAPSGLRAGSLAHAAHTLSPGWGQCC